MVSSDDGFYDRQRRRKIRLSEQGEETGAGRMKNGKSAIVESEASSEVGTKAILEKKK